MGLEDDLEVEAWIWDMFWVCLVLCIAVCDDWRPISRKGCISIF